MANKDLGTMTREKIVRYAGVAQDFNPIHYDDEFARKAGLPGAIAHGPLTVLIALDALIAEGAVGQSGVVATRLKAPVTPGQQLTLSTKEDGAFVVLAGETEALSGTVSARKGGP